MTELTKLTRTAAQGNNDVDPGDLRANESAIANVLIVEHDADCADALETMLSDLPGIVTVQTAPTTGDAFDLLDDGFNDVIGFGIERVTPPAPDVIFIGAHQPDASEIELELIDVLASFRSRVPDAAIVLLCVYPSRYRETLSGLVDGCIRKDTSASELNALINDLRAARIPRAA